MALATLTLLGSYSSAEEWANSDKKHKDWAIKNYGKEFFCNEDFLDGENETMQDYYEQQKGYYTVEINEGAYDFEFSVYEVEAGD